MLNAGSTPPIAGRYSVLRELGRGGMGVVYLVEHLGTGDHLALKLLLGHVGASEEMIERFKREARAPAKIKSEHVVKVTDTDVAPELEGAPFMVMELLNGRDLEKTLREERERFSPHETVHILRQAASALDKAHAMGITHRDLKPENLFLHKRESGEEIVKILDFGISKMAGESANDISQAGLTKSGAMMGTPLYMSPEQARGRVGEIGPGTDIWAIGLIAYRLLTGEVYWDATTLAELMVQIISDPMRPPSQRFPGIPAAFDGWFARSTEREPSKRFRTVGEQVAALAAALAVPLAPPPVTTSADASGWIQAPVVAATMPMMFGAHTTASGLSASSVREAAPKKRSSILPFALLGVVAVGGVTGAAVWQLSRTSSDGAGTAAATQPSAESNSKPRELKPAKTTEPESEAAPFVASATVVKPLPSTTTPRPTTSTKASASAPPPAGGTVSPEPVKTVEAKPAAPAPPPVVETVKKKYDPAAP